MVAVVFHRSDDNFISMVRDIISSHIPWNNVHSHRCENSMSARTHMRTVHTFLSLSALSHNFRQLSVVNMHVVFIKSSSSPFLRYTSLVILYQQDTVQHNTTQHNTIHTSVSELLFSSYTFGIRFVGVSSLGTSHVSQPVDHAHGSQLAHRITMEISSMS